MARTLRFRDVDGLYKTLRTLPREASATLRKASVVIAGDVASKAAVRARQTRGVAKYVAPTLKARSDRIPKVAMGGTKRLPGRRGEHQTVGDVMWGAEFGGQRRKTTQQFAPWRGNGEDAGYFLWPIIRAEYPAVIERYGEALREAVDRAAARGGGS